MLYSQLVVTIFGETSHHLIKQHGDDKNGYIACNALCEWYDWDAVKNEI